MGITVSIPHELDRTEARRRIEKGFAQIIRVSPGTAGTCSERWEGDRLIFNVGAMGQTVSGVLTVLDDAVTMEIDPVLEQGFEFRRPVERTGGNGPIPRSVPGPLGSGGRAQG